MILVMAILDSPILTITKLNYVKALISPSFAMYILSRTGCICVVRENTWFLFVAVSYV